MADDEDEQDAFAGWYDQAAGDPVFRKWMETEFARREKVATTTVPPKSASSELVTRAYLSKRLDSCLEMTGRFLAEMLRPLQKRIEQLERCPTPRFIGLWVEGTEYAPGNMAQWDGSVWHCNATTRDKPGRSPSWTLAVKRGRDGRDARERKDP